MGVKGGRPRGPVFPSASTSLLGTKPGLGLDFRILAGCLDSHSVGGSPERRSGGPFCTCLTPES